MLLLHSWSASVSLLQTQSVNTAMLLKTQKLFQRPLRPPILAPALALAAPSPQGTVNGILLPQEPGLTVPQKERSLTKTEEVYIYIYIYIHTCRAENTQNLHVLESIGRRRLNINTDLQKQISWANQLFMSFWESVLTTPRAPGAAGAPQVPHLGAKAKTSTSADLHAAPEADPSRKNTN